MATGSFLVLGKLGSRSRNSEYSTSNEEKTHFTSGMGRGVWVGGECGRFLELGGGWEIMEEGTEWEKKREERKNADRIVFGFELLEPDIVPATSSATP